LTTQISFASKSIDPISRSFSVEANLPSKKTLRPNMLAILKVVDYTKKDALTIPIKTILKSETGDYVFIVENGKAKKTLIKTGIIYNGEAEIVEGLKFGDLVISLGLNSIN